MDKTIRFGSRWKIGHHIYILAKVGCPNKSDNIHMMKVTLINLTDGNRWCEPILVKNIEYVTQKEWAEIIIGVSSLKCVKR